MVTRRYRSDNCDSPIGEDDFLNMLLKKGAFSFGRLGFFKLSLCFQAEFSNTLLR